MVIWVNSDCKQEGKKISLALIVVLATAAFFGYGKQQGAKPGQAVPVKAMNVMCKKILHWYMNMLVRLC